MKDTQSIAILRACSLCMPGPTEYDLQEWYGGNKGRVDCPVMRRVKVMVELGLLKRWESADFMPDFTTTEAGRNLLAGE